MAETVIALYDDLSAAADALEALLNNQFAREDVSLLAKDASGQYGQYVGAKEVYKQDHGPQIAGAGAGAVLGGLAGIGLVLGMMSVPGIGPALAIGYLLVGGSAGAGIGAAAGGIAGSLADQGIPRPQAELFAQGVRHGATLVAVRAPAEQAAQAAEILQGFGPIELEERSTLWQQESAGVSQKPGGAATAAKDADTTPRDPTAARPIATAAPGARDDSTSTPQAPADRAGFPPADVLDDDFRQHYAAAYSHSPYSFDQLRPAYHLGYDVGRRPRQTNWTEDEAELQHRWEQAHPGRAWETIKPAVRKGWDAARYGGQAETF